MLVAARAARLPYHGSAPRPEAALRRRLCWRVAVACGAPLVLMHMQGSPETMQDNPHYNNVVKEVYDFLLARVAAAEAAGVKSEQIIIDPGIGFGKRREDNLKLLAHLENQVGTCAQQWSNFTHVGIEHEQNLRRYLDTPEEVHLCIEGD